MSTTQINSFDTLLGAWREHQQLRDSGASIAELAYSRSRLDEARHQATTSR